MKLTTSVFVFLLAAWTVAAQTGPVSPKSARPAKGTPAAQHVQPKAKARPAVHRAVQHRREPVRHVAQTRKPAPRVERKPVRRVERKPVRRVERKPVRRVERKPEPKRLPAAEKNSVEAKKPVPSPKTEGAAGRRDPFRSPIVEAGGPVIGCTTGGKKCLAIGQIQLQGVVQAPNGNIAVVVGPEKRTYFLRENDALFNGYVLKITGDSVTFREESKDRLGKLVTHDVVKSLINPAIG